MFVEMDNIERSKPRRIKALLSSFLRRDQECKVSSSSEADGHTEGDSTSAEDSKVTITPLNRDSFLRRVDTFGTSTWFAKPHDLSPLHCARYGWQNVDVDSLSCVSCKQVIYVSLPHLWQKEEYTSSCERVKQQLIYAHGKICPWSSSPSPESFVKISMVDQKQQIASFHQRVSDLLDVTEKLPSFDFSVLANQNDRDDSVINSLREYTTNHQEKKQNVTNDEWNIIILMALFGWQKSHHQVSLPVVMCECCRKQAGLWNYSQRKTDGKEGEDEKDEEHSEENVEPPQKRMKTLIQSDFNPVAEHRPWCPWILSCATNKTSPISPERDNTRPTWQLLLDILLSKADPSKFGSTSPLTNKTQTPPSNAWKAVRRMVSFWQSKESPRKGIPS